VHTLQLEEAKQLLESDDAPVEAIAQEVGYEDAAVSGDIYYLSVPASLVDRGRCQFIILS